MRYATFHLTLALSAAVPLAAQTHFVVDNTGSGTHTSIQAAVTAAAPGDVIEVRTANYFEDVTISSKGITLVSASSVRPTIRGVLTISDVPAGETLLCSNFVVAPFGQAQAGALRPSALVVRNCPGAVRVQGSLVLGASGGWTVPPGFFTPGLPGGRGADVDQSVDVAFIDCTVVGGDGATSPGIPWDGGAGGLALRVQNGSRLLAQRCVVRGGAGRIGESGGSGGSGALVQSSSSLLIGYSAFEGLRGEDAWNLEGGSGGDGLVVEAGATVDDFGGVFAAGLQGYSWMHLGQPPRDGIPVTGAGTVHPVPPAHPSAVHAPAVVRAGTAWSFEVVAESGELALPLTGATSSFRWIPSMRQPLLFLVDRVATSALGGWITLPASGRLDVMQPPATLGPNQTPRVLWLTARIAPTTPRLTSTRAVVVLP